MSSLNNSPFSDVSFANIFLSVACLLIFLRLAGDFCSILFCFSNIEKWGKNSNSLGKGECYKNSQMPRSLSSPKVYAGQMSLFPHVSKDKRSVLR